MVAVDFETIRVGDSLPALEKPPITRLQLALFASAGADHNPIHVDEDAAKAAGLPGVIAHGMLTMAFLGEMLAAWVPQTRIRALSARFVAVAKPGDAITCKAVVAGKTVEGGEKRVELDLVAHNALGDKIQLGRALVVLP